jgi:hypothetical protein
VDGTVLDSSCFPKMQQVCTLKDSILIQHTPPCHLHSGRSKCKNGQETTMIWSQLEISQDKWKTLPAKLCTPSSSSSGARILQLVQWLSYGPDNQGNTSPISNMSKNLSLLLSTHNTSWAHLPSYSMGTRATSPGVKQLRHKPDNSPPSTAKVNNKWS